jgi:hypothetical protein
MLESRKWGVSNEAILTSNTVDDLELDGIRALPKTAHPAPHGDTLLEPDDMLARDFAMRSLNDFERRGSSESRNCNGEGQDGCDGVEETHLDSECSNLGEGRNPLESRH